MSERDEPPPIPADFEQFTPRTALALARGGYRNLGEAQAASDDDLLSLRNFGFLSLAEVRAAQR
jgi:DNA-directed RNA polymerase alpha subunit